MYKLKIKAPSYTMGPIQYKLYDFCEEFSGFRSNVSKKLIGCQNMSSNLSRTKKEGEIIFSNNDTVCQECGSHHIVKNGKIRRELIFLNIGVKICKIQRYQCAKCGNVFITDLSSLVEDNRNITKPVIDFILKSYSIGGDSIRKIMYRLKWMHNVDISYQSVENVILDFNYEMDNDFYSFSGYYLFDALWVKINSVWNYILALFDLQSNTIVSYDLASSESEKSIYKFLSESTYNQDRKYIVTDLKHEYRQPIRKLGFKHQFCVFHTKQKINRDINDYLKQNKVSFEDMESVKSFKHEIFSIMDAPDLETAKIKRDKLIKEQKILPEPIFKILWKFIVPYFKNLTYYIKNSNISRTSNKIENIFQKVFPKHIKRLMKTETGLINRFKLKLEFWNIKNKNQI